MAETIDIRELNMRIEQQSAFVTNLTMGMDRVIVGQKHLIDSLLIGLLSDGHILLEGVPGLAKTLAIKTLAQLISSNYSRIQFTPDLLPADVVGTMVYSQKDEKFHVKKGPVFANDKFLFLYRWIINYHFKHETVYLCFWQLISAFLLNRVLRSHNEEWVRQFEGVVANGHLMLLHRFE